MSLTAPKRWLLVALVLINGQAVYAWLAPDVPWITHAERVYFACWGAAVYAAFAYLLPAKAAQ